MFVCLYSYTYLMKLWEFKVLHSRHHPRCAILYGKFEFIFVQYCYIWYCKHIKVICKDEIRPLNNPWTLEPITVPQNMSRYHPDMYRFSQGWWNAFFKCVQLVRSTRASLCVASSTPGEEGSTWTWTKPSLQNSWIAGACHLLISLEITCRHTIY